MHWVRNILLLNTLVEHFLCIIFQWRQRVFVFVAGSGAVIVAEERVGQSNWGERRLCTAMSRPRLAGLSLQSVAVLFYLDYFLYTDVRHRVGIWVEPKCPFLSSSLMEASEWCSVIMVNVLSFALCCDCRLGGWIHRKAVWPIDGTVCQQVLTGGDFIVVTGSLTLWRCWLCGRTGIRPVKNWVVGCWRGYLSGARCRLAYGPADASGTHCLLLQ